MILILLGLFTIPYYSQDLTQEEKEMIINNLDSTNHSIRLSAILDIYQFDIVESLNKLENTIFQQEQDIAFWFLKSIGKFGSQKIVSISHKFIDTIAYLPRYENYGDSGISINKYKIEAVYWLFKNGDYSTASTIFDYINEITPAIESTSFLLLGKVIEYVPEFEFQAKQELLRIIRIPSENHYSPKAIQILADQYDSEIIPELINVFDNNSYYMARLNALRYLDRLDYFELENFLISRYTTDSTVAGIIVSKILQKYCTPINYNFIISNLNTSLKQADLEYYSLVLKYIEPTPPKTLLTCLEYIDYTNSLCDTLQLYNWLGNTDFASELQSLLQSAKTNLQNGDSLACREEVKSFQDSVNYVYADSLNPDPRFVTLEGWKFLYWNAQYILDRLPEPPANPNLLVTLTNSQGTQITASNVKYYDTSWKDATDNGDGTFTVITTKPTVSVRVFYEGANQTVNNVPAQNNTYTFQTVNAAVQLQNSMGSLIDEGTVQYYAGSWRSFGTTVNGVANKELLPINYSFRMTYEYGSIDKQQDISIDPTVVFQTVNTAVQLQNSLGNLIDEGMVQYYAGAWRSFGTTVNGVAYKELLPKNYSFRMTYEYVSNDKQQDLSTNSTVSFSTVLCTLKVTNANNQPLEGADTKYYSGAWRDIGSNKCKWRNNKRVASKELKLQSKLWNSSARISSRMLELMV